MKVIHVFRTGGAGYGLERNLLCTLPGLVARGVETVALAVVETRSSGMPEEFARQLAEANVRLIQAETHGRLPFRLARDLADVFRKEKPDVIHSHDYKSDLAMLLAKPDGAVRVTTIHGWCSRNLKERFYEWLNVRCCRRMDAVIVFCEDYRRRLLDRSVPAELIRVVPVGLDTNVIPRQGVNFREQWGIPKDAVVVAEIGRISCEKHPEVFVRLAMDLSARQPNARFVLVGDGELRPDLEREVSASGKSDAVLFTGYIHSMSDVLDAIDIAVNCSSTEAIPRTLLEAGIAGIPAVAAAVGGIPDVVVDGTTGILCPPGDVAALEAGVERLIADADLRRTMGAAVRERVQTVFSVDACSRRLVETYESLCRGARTT